MRFSQPAGVDPADQRHRARHGQRAAGAQAHRAGARVPRRCARFAPDGAHGRDLRLARDRAADHRLSILARVPEPRHRQLVQGRDQAGPLRRARAVEVRDGRAHARIRAQHPAVRQPARRQSAVELGRGHRRAARRERRPRSRGLRHARPGAGRQQRRGHLDQPAAGVVRGHQRHLGRQRLLEPGAAVGRRLPDQHGGAYRDRPGIERRSLRGGAVSRAAATRAPVGSRAAFLFAALQPDPAARGREEPVRHDAHPGAAAGDAHRHLRCYLLRREARAAGAGSDRRHARGRQGRLRHAPAAAVARRDGIPRALVQRHDQAPAARARRHHAQPAGRRTRTRTAVDHPRAPVDGRHRHRARPETAQRQPGGQQHSRRRISNWAWGSRLRR